MENIYRRAIERNRRAIESAQREYAIAWPFLDGEQTDKGPPLRSELDIEEEMIDLYTIVTALLPSPGGKLLLFIGAREGEGTSTLIREFARVAYVQFNKSVFLLDLVSSLSPQKYHVERSLEVVGQETDLMGEILSELADSRFLVCPISKLGDSLTRMLGSPHLESFFGKLRQRFDFILIDSPPATHSAVGLALAHKMDGVLLVVEADKTRWSVAQHVKNRIIQAHGNILGVILNKRRYYIPAFIYKWI
jgi:protein-tyrosine kinase